MIDTITYYKDYKFKVGDYKYIDKKNNILEYRYLNIKEIENEYYKELGLQEIRAIHIFLRELKIFKLMNKKFIDKKYQGKVLYNYYWKNSGMYGTFSGNVFIGYYAGYSTTTGNYGVSIGYPAGLTRRKYNLAIRKNNYSTSTDPNNCYTTITI